MRIYISRQEAEKLPAWSIIRVSHDPEKKQDLVPLNESKAARLFNPIRKHLDGLWLSLRPGRHYGGIGSSLFVVLYLGSGEKIPTPDDQEAFCRLELDNWFAKNRPERVRHPFSPADFLRLPY